jgi:hypothetical protein
VYYATRNLLTGTDLSDGFPADPHAAYRERWDTVSGALEFELRAQ